MKPKYIFANKDNSIFIADIKPRRHGSIKIKNSWGKKYEYIVGNHVETVYWKVNSFKPDDAMVEVTGYEGVNDLWDDGDDKLLGIYTITKDDCDHWGISGGNKLEISESACNKLFGCIPTWDDDPIEVTF